MIVKSRRSYRGADMSSNHYLVKAIIRMEVVNKFQIRRRELVTHGADGQKNISEEI